MTRRGPYEAFCQVYVCGGVRGVYAAAPQGRRINALGGARVRGVSAGSSQFPRALLVEPVTGCGAGVVDAENCLHHFSVALASDARVAAVDAASAAHQYRRAAVAHMEAVLAATKWAWADPFASLFLQATCLYPVFSRVFRHGPSSLVRVSGALWPAGMVQNLRGLAMNLIGDILVYKYIIMMY